MKFLSKSTKIQGVVASVLTALALIVLIMLSTLIQFNEYSNRVMMTFIYTVCLVFILLIWHGILQIKVFSDYKSKRSYLCADGILSLCMGTLLIVSGILLATLQLHTLLDYNLITGTADIRIFLTCFLAIIAFWKLAVVIIAIKEKHFNWWCEMLFMIFWLMLSILCLTSMFINGSTLTGILWSIVAFSWALIILTIFYILYSYIIKTPKYLETEEAIQQKQEEIDQIKSRKEKLLERKSSSNNVSTTYKDKLKKLKELRDDNLISEEEYLDKKSEILNKF